MEKIKNWLKRVSESAGEFRKKIKSKRITPAVLVAVGMLIALSIPIWTVIAVAIAVFYYWYVGENGEQ